MKSFFKACGVVGVLLLLFPINSFGGWVLYDDFNSGAIDVTKWSENNAPLSEPISVEDGAAKFILDTDNKNVSGWLGILQSPEKVKGIRAKVKFASNVVGVRARMAGYVGTTQDGDPVWNQICMQQGLLNAKYNVYVWYASGALLNSNRNNTIMDYLYGEFPRPLAGTYSDPTDLTGEWVTLEILFNPAKFTYGLPDPQYNWYLKKYKPLFKINKFPKVPNAEDTFKGIGVRASNAAPDGQECIIYFDDVWVLR